MLESEAEFLARAKEIGMEESFITALQRRAFRQEAVDQPDVLRLVNLLHASKNSRRAEVAEGLAWRRFLLRLYQASKRSASSPTFALSARRVAMTHPWWMRWRSF